MVCLPHIQFHVKRTSVAGTQDTHIHGFCVGSDFGAGSVGREGSLFFYRESGFQLRRLGMMGAAMGNGNNEARWLFFLLKVSVAG